MNQDQVLDEFRAAGALLEGHFVLSSVLHSPVFFQKNAVFMDPTRTERLCRALAEKARAAFGKIEVVVSPAVGAIIPGYETARHLGARAMFVEREGGKFQLRRGFTIKASDRVLMVEDVVTKGGRVQETIDIVRQRGGDVVAAGTLVDRSQGKVSFGVPLVSLLKLEIETFDHGTCPMCREGTPVVKPGS